MSGPAEKRAGERPAGPIGENERPSLLEWACLVAGVVLLLRYAWLMDDAFVYFRYVDNLVFLGHGLVYNRGEFVEGFSSPLWALLLSALRTTELPYWLLVRILGVASFVVCWLLLIRVNRKLSPSRAPTLNLPVLFVSLAYGPLCYFTSGLEMPLVQLAAPVYALALLSPAAWPLDIALALLPLLRHELALPLGLYGLFLWSRDRRFPWRLFTLSGLCLGGWLLFRVWYYADLFQNTFYLKNLVEIPQGLLYLRNTLDPYALHAWLVLHLALAVWLRRRGAMPLHLAERGVMVAASVALTLYVVKIGGDPRHYRFLAFPVLLGLCAVSGLAEHALVRIPAARRTAAAAAGAVVFGGVALFAYPEQLLEHPLRGNDRAVMVDKIKDAAEHRRMEMLTPPFGSLGRELEPMEAYRRRAGRDVPYPAVYSQSGCVHLYNAWDRYALHTLGLTDAILARTAMPVNRPAHKLGLIPLAHDLEAILRGVRGAPHRGLYRDAVESGEAPDWIAANLDTIEVIERKAYNSHDLRENLGLALRFPPPVQAPAGSGASAREP